MNSYHRRTNLTTNIVIQKHTCMYKSLDETYINYTMPGNAFKIRTAVNTEIQQAVWTFRHTNTYVRARDRVRECGCAFAVQNRETWWGNLVDFQSCVSHKFEPHRLRLHFLVESRPHLVTSVDTLRCKTAANIVKFSCE